jgi:hypothetical protein
VPAGAVRARKRSAPCGPEVRAGSVVARGAVLSHTPRGRSPPQPLELVEHCVPSRELQGSLLDGSDYLVESFFYGDPPAVAAITGSQPARFLFYIRVPHDRNIWDLL